MIKVAKNTNLSNMLFTNNTEKTRSNSLNVKGQKRVYHANTNQNNNNIKQKALLKIKRILHNDNILISIRGQSNFLYTYHKPLELHK